MVIKIYRHKYQIQIRSTPRSSLSPSALGRLISAVKENKHHSRESSRLACLLRYLSRYPAWHPSTADQRGEYLWVRNQHKKFSATKQPLFLPSLVHASYCARTGNMTYQRQRLPHQNPWPSVARRSTTLCLGRERGRGYLHLRQL